MTDGIEKTAAAELEALGKSGFALAIQLLGRHEDAADVVQDALRKLVHNRQYDSQRGKRCVNAWGNF